MSYFCETLLLICSLDADSYNLLYYSVIVTSLNLSLGSIQKVPVYLNYSSYLFAYSSCKFLCYSVYIGSYDSVLKGMLIYFVESGDLFDAGDIFNFIYYIIFKYSKYFYL